MLATIPTAGILAHNAPTVLQYSVPHIPRYSVSQCTTVLSTTLYHNIPQYQNVPRKYPSTWYHTVPAYTTVPEHITVHNITQYHNVPQYSVPQCTTVLHSTSSLPHMIICICGFSKNAEPEIRASVRNHQPVVYLYVLAVLRQCSELAAILGSMCPVRAGVW